MIIIVFGLPGSGKSYFASALAGRLKGRLISSDAVRRQINQNGQYNDDARLDVYLEMLSLMVVGIKAHRPVVLDATFYRDDIRKLFAEKAMALGEPVYFVELKAAEETIRARVAVKRQDSEADFAAYLKVKLAFEPFARDHLVLHSDREPLGRMLATALAYLNGTAHETE